MENKRKVNFNIFKITDLVALNEAERQYREREGKYEHIPWANTSYKEIASEIITDKYGGFTAPLYLSVSNHRSTYGIKNLCRQMEKYIQKSEDNENTQILSITGYMQDGRITIVTLVRKYEGNFNIVGFFETINDEIYEKESNLDIKETGCLIIPDKIKNFSYSKEEIFAHEKAVKKQNEVLNNASEEKPFLNSIDEYVPLKLPNPENHTELIYDLQTLDRKIETVMPYDEFNEIFKELLVYVNGVEYYHYINVIKGDESKEVFMDFLRTYIMDSYVSSGSLASEDVDLLLKKLYRALFEMHVVQDLINDKNVTDINITAPDAIRVRIKGKTYISNVTFIDRTDYLRFVNAISIKNHVLQSSPEQTFTETGDEDYILRITITPEYVNSVDWPYMHIRKVSRKKLLGEDLIKEGMMNKVVRNYLLDCGLNSKGVMFSGPPGSGKTVALNWFLEEAYELSADILVIQESDELFAYRKGVKLEHVVRFPKNNEEAVDLGRLGKSALVAGANVFIIGETKGAEICEMVTLGNTGCRIASTLHTASAVETPMKMVDLMMRGDMKDVVQAKRMLKNFQTLVYLEDFKIQEITEVIGFDEEKKDLIYRYIYRREKTS